MLEQQKKLLETIKLNDKIGFDGIREFATIVRKDLMTYVKMEKDGLFPTFSDTTKHPTIALKYNKSQISTYLKNMQTIVNFIETGLSNDQLFHSILYSYISVPEKYLLGIFYYYGKEFETLFLKDNFNYIEYYETSLERYKNEQNRYFPVIGANPKGYRTFYTETLQKADSILTLIITATFDYYLGTLQFDSVNCQILDKYRRKIFFNDFINEIIKVEQDEGKIKVDVSDLIRQEVPKLKNSDFTFEYSFSFIYDGRKYSSTYSHGLYKTTDINVDEADDYSEVTRYVLTDFE